MTSESAIRELTNAPSLYVAYCRYTNLPYVTEGEESANDQAWIFADEKQLKAFGEEKKQEKILLMGMRYDKKDYNRLYATLYAIDVNAVVYVKGTEQVEVELEKIARQPDFSALEEKKRPLFNPGLQLCAIYFLQQLRKPVEKPEERMQYRPMEEEFLYNLRKAQFLVPMEVNPKDPKKINIPFLKNKNGDMMQPAFTDVYELEKFTRGKQPKAVKIPFEKLSGLLLEQSKAFVINPLGFNLPLDRDQLKKIGTIKV